MVYRKNKLKVLLGPAEKIQQQLDAEAVKGQEDSHLYVKSAGIRKPSDVIESSRVGETNVHNRTRPNSYQPTPQSRPSLERYPSGFMLSGQKVETEDTKAKLASAKSAPATKHVTTPTENLRTDEADVMSQKGKVSQAASEAQYTPSFHKTRNARGNFSASNTLSKYFLTDFGFRSERTDTFSGHHRRKGVASSEMERQIQEKADRHIRACQTVGHVKRSSKAQIGYQGLREAVSPRHSSRSSPLTFYSQQERLSKNLLKENNFFETDKQKSSMVPYMIQIRKNVGSVSRIKSIGAACQRNDPLPEISGRTLIVGSGYGNVI